MYLLHAQLGKSDSLSNALITKCLSEGMNKSFSIILTEHENLSLALLATLLDHFVIRLIV